jgi:hypothetical protein
MQTVLAKIVADKAIWVEARKQQQPLASFQNDVVPTQRNFYALAGTAPRLFWSAKRRLRRKADSRGFRPGAIAGIYKAHARPSPCCVTRNISRAASISADRQRHRAAADSVQGLHHRPLPDLPGALLPGRRLPADALGADDEQYRQLPPWPPEHGRADRSQQ